MLQKPRQEKRKRSVALNNGHRARTLARHFETDYAEFPSVLRLGLVGPIEPLVVLNFIDREEVCRSGVDLDDLAARIWALDPGRGQTSDLMLEDRHGFRAEREEAMGSFYVPDQGEIEQVRNAIQQANLRRVADGNPSRRGDVEMRVVPLLGFPSHAIPTLGVLSY